MKKIIYLVLVLGMGFTMSAQTINGIELEDVPSKYLEGTIVISTSRAFSPLSVYFDYGQMKSRKDLDKGHIIGKDGVKVPFTGFQSVLNFLDKKGFKYINQYATVISANNSVVTILFENTNLK